MELRVNTFGPRAPGPTADPEFSALCKPLSCASRSVQAEECKAAEDQSLDVTRGSNSDFKRGSKLPNSEMQQRVRSFSPGQQWAPGSGALGSPPPASPPAAFPLGSPEAKLETSAQPGTEQSHEADLHPRALLRDEAAPKGPSTADGAQSGTERIRYLLHLRGRRGGGLRCQRGCLHLLQGFVLRPSSSQILCVLHHGAFAPHSALGEERRSSVSTRGPHSSQVVPPATER